MPQKHRFYATLAASALALALSAAAASAQQPLPSLPKPETPPPVPAIDDEILVRGGVVDATHRLGGVGLQPG